MPTILETKQILLRRVPQWLHTAAKLTACRQNISLEELIEQALQAYLEAHAIPEDFQPQQG